VGEITYSVLDNGDIIFRYNHPDDGSVFEAEIRCPLESRLHEQNREILDQHRTWARSFHLPPSEDSYQRYCDTRFDLLAAYQYAGQPVESAVIHSHLMTWFFVFDDVMDIDHGQDEDLRAFRSELCKRHLEILGGEPVRGRDSRCLLAFSDFLGKVKALSGTGYMLWYERMLHHLREYVQGAYWESLIGPTTAANANTALYLQVRHMAVGVAPCIDLMAIGAGIPASPFTDNDYIRRMERMAINYSIWVNDLAGLNRDMKRGLGNVIFTLQRDHSLTLVDATRMVARMCDGELAAFLQAEKQLPILLGQKFDRNSAAYEAYINVMKRWMRGLLDWSARSDRYRRLDIDMALQNKTLIRQISGMLPKGR
jgi:5-epi-alpha-selinene synthase